MFNSPSAHHDPCSGLAAERPGEPGDGRFDSCLQGTLSRPYSSAVERALDKREVVGSAPARATNRRQACSRPNARTALRASRQSRPSASGCIGRCRQASSYASVPSMSRTSLLAGLPTYKTGSNRGRLDLRSAARLLGMTPSDLGKA